VPGKVWVSTGQGLLPVGSMEAGKGEPCGHSIIHKYWCSQGWRSQKPSLRVIRLVKWGHLKDGRKGLISKEVV